MRRSFVRRSDTTFARGVDEKELGSAWSPWGKPASPENTLKPEGVLPRRGETATGRITLGLYNCYDPKQWQEIMRITLARAGPVAVAFDCDLATFGFPFEQARARGAKSTDALRSPDDVARFVAEGTSIGEGGELFRDLADAGRFHIHPFPADGVFPPRFGRVVATTPAPDPAKASTPLAVATEVMAGHDQLLVYGLGPRGLPRDVLARAPVHLELTGRGLSMETATALGALPAMLSAHLLHLRGGAS
jgi:uncharacterized protein